MASMTMTASFLGGSAAATISKQPPTAGCSRRVFMVKASKDEKVVMGTKNEDNSTRRDLMFAVAAAAAFSVAKVAMADEPRRGSAEAKKKYATICVTMPTARICRN
ncbi:Photosystem II 5 kD protein [Forsythia ovata]|uniref:Photosystem II 5 kD protein n=1 Tax=Forsythia ovata TaxID=205694 RepID=A0ABD1X693_9LAMI